MTNVPRGDGCFSRDSDSRDLGVANFDAAAEPPPLGRESSSCLRGDIVKRKHTTVEIVGEDLCECVFQSAAAATRLQDFESEPDFEDGHGCRPDGLRSLPIQPGQNAIVRLLSDQFRKDIRIEQNHRFSFGGTAGWPRSSAISSPSRSPIRAKRAAIRDPKGSRRVDSSFTALRRISRTSSSVLRPCRRARRCRRVFTSSSRLRTISCATATMISRYHSVTPSRRSSSSRRARLTLSFVPSFRRTA